MPQHFDEEDLERLLVSKAGFLTEFVQRRIPNALRKVVEAEDVVQEAWITAFRDRKSFENKGPNSFDRWLTTIARRRLIDISRTAAAFKRTAGEEVETFTFDGRSSMVVLFNDIASPDKTPSGFVTIAEASKAARHALETLAPERRQVLEFRYLQGRSIGEIATLMNKTVPAISSLIFKARSELRTNLGRTERFLTDDSMAASG